MNIFFTGAVSGGRAHQPEYELIVKTLEQYGIVYSAHVQDETLSRYGETNEKAADILSRELEALNLSGIAVAEVSTPSLGVGYLLAKAASAGKKIIALFEGEDTLKLSAIIKGDPRIEVHTYRTIEDVEQVLSSLANN
jgi:2'-deoxynucleoside 5'-phosphate N-hydrolase